MPVPVRSSTLKSGLSISNLNALLDNTIASGVAGNTTIATVVAYKNVTSGDLVSAVSGHTLCVDVDGVPARVKVIGGGNTLEITKWRKSNISAGTQSATVTLVNANSDVTWHFDEYEDIDLTTPIDKISFGTSASNTSPINTGTTGTLTQTENVIVAAAANKYNYLWGGGSYGNVLPPAGFTKIQGTYNSATDIPMISVWKDVSSTAGVSAAFQQFAQPDNGGAAIIMAMRLDTGPAPAELDVGGTIVPVGVNAATVSAPAVTKTLTATVTVTVLGTDGLPFEGISVALTSGSTSKITVASSPQTTNAQGIATFTITGVDAGTSVLTANVDSGAVVVPLTAVCISAAAPVWETTALPVATPSTSYSTTVVATGQGISYSLPGGFGTPGWLSIGSSSGILAGSVPSNASAPALVTVRATSTNGSTTDRVFVLVFNVADADPVARRFWIGPDGGGISWKQSR